MNTGSDPEDTLKLTENLVQQFRALHELHEVAPTERQRTVALYALMEIIDYLHALAPGENLDTPLLPLAAALTDLQSGIVAPIVCPAPAKPGRPRAPVGNDLVKVVAAAAMAALMDGGCDRQKSAKAVAGVLIEEGYQVTAKALTWRTVARWRDELSMPPKRSNVSAPFSKTFFIHTAKLVDDPNSYSYELMRIQLTQSRGTAKLTPGSETEFRAQALEVVRRAIRFAAPITRSSDL